MSGRRGVHLVYAAIFPVLAFGAACGGGSKASPASTSTSASTTAVGTATPTTATSAGSPVPPASQPSKITFTAKQAKGSGGAGEQFDTYSGTATPRDIVKVRSAYGNGQAAADESGRWEVKVLFAGAPLKVNFVVEASTPSGTQSFSWVRTA